jgi:ring-1,2-phenylacetyl-CoA epoxidase subunit PaaD
VVDRELTPEFLDEVLDTVPDPEIPVLTIRDLGILRNAEVIDGKAVITITPTYTGCPAMKAIEEEIGRVLNEAGITDYSVRTVLSPVWTTDWMTEEARQKLRDYGIAPPEQSTEEHLRAIATGKRKQVQCPFCTSTDTKLTSPFGSTACKALHYCNNCQQPFEEFKCH